MCPGSAPRRACSTRRRNLVIPGGTPDGSWKADAPYLVRQSFQRHLLQLGYVDSLLGRLLDQLDDTGTWDETMLVVTADHGIAFRPGSPLRAPTPETIHEIYNVPLFVKLPGQATGGPTDENALTIDVLPTIVDALDTETDWEFDGESLLGEDHRPDKPVVYAGTTSVVPADVSGVLAVARRNATYVPRDDGWLGVAAVGPYGDLVGRAVDQLETTPVTGVSWSLDEAPVLGGLGPRRPPQLAPILVHGTLDPGILAVPTDALLAVNGRVAGAVGGFTEDGSNLSFSALLAEELLAPGANQVTLLLPVSAGARSFHTRPPQPLNERRVRSGVRMASPSPPQRRLGRVAALDGIRGLAVLLVVTSHLNLLVPRQDITRIGLIDGMIEGGYLGVDLFLVLSGFLITALLLGEERGRGEIRFRAFYARRAIRLLPALYFMLLCHAAYTLLTELDWSAEVASIRAAVLYYSNWQVVYDLSNVATGTNHLWSLAVEEQFYLVWPALLVGFLGLRYRALTVTAVLGVAVVAIAVHRAMLWDDGANWLELFVRTDTRADALLIGALLASLWVRGVTPVRWVDPAAWLALALMVVYLATVEPSSGFSFRGGSTVFALLTAVVLLAVLNGTWGAARWLAVPALRAVGLVSYGLYLWHFPVFHVVARYGDDLPEVVRVAVGSTVATTMTLVSWFLLERPMQALRVRFGERGPQPTTVT